MVANEIRGASGRYILVGVDDSVQAKWALDEGVRLARLTDARVCLVHVVDVAPVLVPEFAFEEAMRGPGLVAEGWDLVHALSERIPAGYRGQLLVREGPADKEIVLAAQEIGAQLLVIGTHGRGLLGRFLLGSTAESVVRHAMCPVVTVGHAPRQDRAEPTPKRETQASLTGT